MTRLALLLALAALPAAAHDATVEAIALHPSGATWTVSVTIRHAETGWDDYADGWRVEAPDGTILGTRTLLHPHAEEQPFTRSLGGVTIPQGLTEVHIRTRTSTTDWSDKTTPASLP